MKKHTVFHVNTRFTSEIAPRFEQNSMGLRRRIFLQKAYITLRAKRNTAAMTFLSRRFLLQFLPGGYPAQLTINKERRKTQWKLKLTRALSE